MSRGSLRMSDAKPRRQTELSNYPLPSHIYLVEMHSFYTQNTQMVSYQCINTIFCHVFKAYVTEVPSSICTTVSVLKANTSKTEMKKTGRKIPPRNTTEPLPLKSHPDSHLTMTHLCAALPYHLYMIRSALSIISSPSVYKRTFQS